MEIILVSSKARILQVSKYEKHIKRNRVVMKFRGLLLSKWSFYLLTTLGLVMFNFVLLPHLVQNQIITGDLANNLHSEFLGILFTVTFLIALFEIRDYFERNSVRNQAINILGRELEEIYKIVEVITDGLIWNGPLDKVENKKLASIGRKIFSGTESLTRMNLLQRLIAKQRSLNNIEIKYSDFLQPEQHISLIELQHSLGLLDLGLKLRDWVLKHKSEKEYFNLFFDPLFSIIKEIRKLAETGIEIINFLK